MRQALGLLIRQFIGTDNDAELTTGLDGVGLHHTRVREGDILHLLQALDVALHHLTTSTRTGTRNSIADLDDGGDKRGHLHLVVVSTDGVANLGLLLILLGELHTDHGVRQLGLVIGHLADIVQQTGTAGMLGVQTQLGSHDTGQVGRLAGVLQQVLTIRRAVLHLTDQADQLGMQAVDTQVDRRALTHLNDLLLDLLLNLGYHLLDAGGVDTAVGHKLVQGQAGDLTTHGVKAAEDDGLGRIIHNDLDTRSGLQGADVATLAADDATLHLVAFDVKDSHGILDCRLGCYALNRGYHDALGLLRSRELGLLNRLVDVGGGLGLRLRLHVLDQDVLGLLRAQTRDLLQAHILLTAHLLELLLLVVEELHLVLHLLLEAVVLLELVVQVALLVLQCLLELLGALLTLLQLLVALIDLTVVVALQLHEVLLGLEHLLLFDHLTLGLGLLEGSLTALADRGLRHEVRHHGVDCDGHNSRD